MKPNIRAFRRIVIFGVCPASAKMLSTSPIRRGAGSVRWKHLPSRPRLCARWSSASATKSTGTMLMRPPSMPTIGTHGGSRPRIFCRNLKK